MENRELLPLSLSGDFLAQSRRAHLSLSFVIIGSGSRLKQGNLRPQRGNLALLLFRDFQQLCRKLPIVGGLTRKLLQLRVALLCFPVEFLNGG